MEDDAFKIKLLDENVFSNEDMLIERYNDQWALIENKKIQYQLFKGKKTLKKIYIGFKKDGIRIGNYYSGNFGYRENSKKPQSLNLLTIDI